MLNFLASEVPNSFYDKLKRGIFAEAQTVGKIKSMTDEIKNFVGRGFISTDFEEIMTIAVKRVVLIWEFRLNK